jgi:hypothetical protein
MGGAYACPEVLDDLGLNCSDLPRVLKWLHDENEKGEILETRDREVLALTDKKWQVARDLVAGRLTLLEAAARYRDLPGINKEVWLKTVRSEPGTTDSECFCRHAIGWVRHVLEFDAPSPSVRADVLARLENELAKHLQQGDIHLP